MKKCPFCAEEIQDEAIKCKHCGEFLHEAARTIPSREKIKWYFSKTFIVIVFGCVGPLALPLIWWRPQTSRTWKIVLTIFILTFTWFMYQATVKSVEEFNEIYKMLEGQSL